MFVHIYRARHRNHMFCLNYFEFNNYFEYNHNGDMVSPLYF